MSNRKRQGRGEGSIEQLPSGKFRAIVNLGKGADGRRRKMAETFDTAEQARRDSERPVSRGLAAARPSLRPRSRYRASAASASTKGTEQDPA